MTTIPTAIDWTPADRALASAEGWDLFDCDGSQNGPLQLQSFDTPEEGQPDIDDMTAWELVWKGAQAGVEHHKKALAIIASENPIEYEAIRRRCEKGAG